MHIFKNLTRFTTFVIMSLLVACAGDDISSSIDRGGNGGGGGKDPDGKPIVTLSNRVMLTLAGLADLHEVLTLALAGPDTLGCAKRSGNTTIEWNCREDQSRPASRKGQVQMNRQGQTLSVTSEVLALIATVKDRGQTVRADQQLSLQVQNSRLSMVSSYSYQIPQNGKLTRYELTWQIRGNLSAVTPNFALADADVLLTIHRAAPGGREITLQYQITGDEKPLVMGGCGVTNGTFAFSGFEQEQLAVIANETDVHSNGAKNKFLWPTCSTNLYALKLAAPFWRQPEP
ncbi:MAG: hypothetical protein AB7N80_06645 [Bdellovibrionales bacterium]